MTAPDIVPIITALGALLISVGGLVVQILTILKVKDTAVNVVEVKRQVAEVQKHTNGMQEAMIASAKKEGAQEEKDK